MQSSREGTGSAEEGEGEAGTAGSGKTPRQEMISIPFIRTPPICIPPTISIYLHLKDVKEADYNMSSK